MYINSKERKLIYYPIERDEIIERDLDEFIVFMVATGQFDGKRYWHYQNDICSFFGIHNATFYPNEDGLGHIYTNSHHAEKMNLINELIEIELLKPKSSRTFYLGEDFYDEDLVDTIIAMDTLYRVLKKAVNKRNLYMYHKLKETCVLSQKDENNYFIAWHENKFHPYATVDKLKELGWKAFYELNKDNIKKKREYFKYLQAQDI